MGIYSETAKKAFLESDSIYAKHTEDYYKSRMFYGYAQVLIDAKSDSEARYFAARAINDFDIFKTAYKQREDMKLNGIVLRPVGEANDFVACYTDPDTKSRLFETVRIIDGKIESCIVKETEDSNPEESSEDIAIKGSDSLVGQVEEPQNSTPKTQPVTPPKPEQNNTPTNEAVVLSEGAKEIFGKIKEGLKKILTTIINKLDSFLSKFPNSKFATRVRELLGKAKETLNKTKEANSAEDLKQATKETDDLDKKCQDLDEELKKAKEDLEKDKQGESEEDEEFTKSMNHIDNMFKDIIDDNQKEIDRLRKQLDNMKINRDKKVDKSEPIDVEYKELESESMNLAIDF